MRWLVGIPDSMDRSLLVMDREAWRAAVHGVAKTRLRDRADLSALCVNCFVVQTLN